MKKLITVSVPVYNEKRNLPAVYERVTAVMAALPAYDYELVFFDDGSTDGSREEIEALCARDAHVKAVFFARNFGYGKAIFYAMQQARGDCAVLLHADLQNPPELIPAFVREWENGAAVAQGVKNKSRENPVMFFLRSVYYFLMIRVFGVPMVPHATDFELVDAAVLRVLREYRGNAPFLRGLLLEYSPKTVHVPYTQDKRTQEKTKFNVGKYYDFAINGIVSASRKLPRRILLLTAILVVLLAVETVCFAVARAAAGPAADLWNGLILRLVGFAVLFGQAFTAVLFEYVIGLTKNAEKKPLVTEEKRVGY